MEFDRQRLTEEGFSGWVPFSELPTASVPASPGVYVVYRAAPAEPSFLKISPAGHFKGRDPTVSVAVLTSKWVTGATVIYIGKAQKQTLRQRLSQYRRFGEGGNVGHWGGRYTWQLADSADLLVAWKPTTEDAGVVEGRLIRAFEATYGKLPLANISRGAG